MVLVSCYSLTPHDMAHVPRAAAAKPLESLTAAVRDDQQQEQPAPCASHRTTL